MRELRLRDSLPRVPNRTTGAEQSSPHPAPGAPTLRPRAPAPAEPRMRRPPQRASPRWLLCLLPDLRVASAICALFPAALFCSRDLCSRSRFLGLTAEKCNLTETCVQSLLAWNSVCAGTGEPGDAELAAGTGWGNCYRNAQHRIMVRWGVAHTKTEAPC